MISPIRWVNTAMAVAGGSGFAVGAKDCAWGKKPLVTDRFACGFLLGVVWSGHTVFMPFAALHKADCLLHGRQCDMMSMYKQSYRMITDYAREPKDGA